MSGLLTLLDDIAALAKIAAVHVDDVAGQAAKVGAKVVASVVDDTAKAGAKSLGVVIDDTAVTPKYVHNLPAARELPIVWKIARGSVFNKIVVLLPLALLLDAFAPWLMTPLLMIGGAYLSFEGAEKIVHLFAAHEGPAEEELPLEAARLEEERVAGAIKTDFILSAEIMTIALAAIEAQGTLTRGIVLALVAVGITALVYGAVALLVKADDAGLVMARAGRLAATRWLGRRIVRAMPGFMTAISTVGTAAMLWVGGSILVHGLESFGIDEPGHLIAGLSASAAAAVPQDVAGAVAWIVTAGLDGVFGLAVGLAIVLVLAGVVRPVAAALRGRRDA